MKEKRFVILLIILNFVSAGDIDSFRDVINEVSRITVSSEAYISLAGTRNWEKKVEFLEIMEKLKNQKVRLEQFMAEMSDADEVKTRAPSAVLEIDAAVDMLKGSFSTTQMVKDLNDQARNLEGKLKYCEPSLKEGLCRTEMKFEIQEISKYTREFGKLANEQIENPDLLAASNRVNQVTDKLDAMWNKYSSANKDPTPIIEESRLELAELKKNNLAILQKLNGLKASKGDSDPATLAACQEAVESIASTFRVVKKASAMANAWADRSSAVFAELPDVHKSATDLNDAIPKNSPRVKPVEADIADRARLDLDRFRTHLTVVKNNLQNWTAFINLHGTDNPKVDGAKADVPKFVAMTEQNRDLMLKRRDQVNDEALKAEIDLDVNEANEVIKALNAVKTKTLIIKPEDKAKLFLGRMIQIEDENLKMAKKLKESIDKKGIEDAAVIAQKDDAFKKAASNRNEARGILQEVEKFTDAEQKKKVEEAVNKAIKTSDEVRKVWKAAGGTVEEESDESMATIWNVYLSMGTVLLIKHFA